ncbi:MAG: hypothetical protein V1846_02765 [Candidatus Komeilibacteria bacterium]
MDNKHQADPHCLICGGNGHYQPTPESPEVPCEECDDSIFFDFINDPSLPENYRQEVAALLAQIRQQRKERWERAQQQSQINPSPS